MQDEKPILKYLFRAYLKNGDVIQQTPEDKSKINPTKSEFFDLINTYGLSQIVKFELEGEGRIYSVNLIDGHFEINGIPFRFHDDTHEFDHLRLIYARRHYHDFNIGMDELGHHVIYRLGWQYTDAHNKNVERVMEFE